MTRDRNNGLVCNRNLFHRVPRVPDKLILRYILFNRKKVVLLFVEFILAGTKEQSNFDFHSGELRCCKNQITNVCSHHASASVQALIVTVIYIWKDKREGEPNKTGANKSCSTRLLRQCDAQSHAISSGAPQLRELNLHCRTFNRSTAAPSALTLFLTAPASAE